MKRKLKYLIPLLIVGTIGWLGWQVQTKLEEKEEIESKRSQLPNFSFTDLAGKTFQASSLPSDKPTVVMFIHPECPHCQYEAEALYNQQEAHGHISWVLVSEAPQEKLEWLNKVYKLEELENVSLLHAELGAFYSYFGSDMLPSTFVYDKSKNLVKYYKGEVKLEAIRGQVKD